MKCIHVEILGGEEALAAFTAGYRSAEAGKVATPRLAFGSLSELLAALTEQRLELIRIVATHEGMYMRQIEAELEHDGQRLHSDVVALLDLGLLENDEHGGLRAPFDEIIIHVRTRSAG